MYKTTKLASFANLSFVKMVQTRSKAKLFSQIANNLPIERFYNHIQRPNNMWYQNAATNKVISYRAHMNMPEYAKSIRALLENEYSCFLKVSSELLVPIVRVIQISVPF